MGAEVAFVEAEKRSGSREAPAGNLACLENDRIFLPQRRTPSVRAARPPAKRRPLVDSAWHGGII
jgi:hypothetical protein